jgi:hydroxyacylglutathione hydrolase
MKSVFAGALAALLLAAPAGAAIEPGSMDVHWNPGSPDCKAHPQPPLQVHAYNKTTFILRENPCATWEAPFMYLLVGKARALLIDDGAVKSARKVPVAKTVMALLPAGLPLLVVHTHRHMDHRAGDGQFEHRPHVRVIGYDLASVKRFYGFAHWPQGLAHVDLGGRIVDVFPIPGHNLTHVAFYDRNTALFFSGDFLMPGRLLIDDPAADIASAKRAAAFAKDRPVSYVLGGHIEENAAGKLFPWASTWHPDEHVLQMTKADILALPAAVERFNGFYSHIGKFVFIDTMRMLALFAAGALVILVALIWTAVFFIRRRLRATH